MICRQVRMLVPARSRLLCVGCAAVRSLERQVQAVTAALFWPWWVQDDSPVLCGIDELGPRQVSAGSPSAADIHTDTDGAVRFGGRSNCDCVG